MSPRVPASAVRSAPSNPGPAGRSAAANPAPPLRLTAAIKAIQPVPLLMTRAAIRRRATGAVLQIRAVQAQIQAAAETSAEAAGAIAGSCAIYPDARGIFERKMER